MSNTNIESKIQKRTPRNSPVDTTTKANPKEAALYDTICDMGWYDEKSLILFAKKVNFLLASTLFRDLAKSVNAKPHVVAKRFVSEDWHDIRDFMKFRYDKIVFSANGCLEQLMQDYSRIEETYWSNQTVACQP